MTEHRRVERTEPLPIKGQTLGVFVPVATIERLNPGVDPDRLEQALRETVDACNRKVTIPMKLGTDSLNVAVAAGIFLYHFTSIR